MALAVSLTPSQKPDPQSDYRDLMVLADFGAVAQIIDNDSGGCDRVSIPPI